ncbi:MAG: hypothetical protein RMJ52_02180 [Gemmataceae bacterium]|nr:hypothetical protein [Gemmataceae bacterium]
MARAGLGGGVAAVVLALLAGCHVTDLFTLSFSHSGPEGSRSIVLTGSLESVAELIQRKLQELGMAVETLRDGADTRVACTTPTGGKIYFVLSPVKGRDGQRTRVRLDWDGTTDRDQGLALLGQLSAQMVLKH